MLASLDQGKISLVIFMQKDGHVLWANIAPVIFCAMLPQKSLDNIVLDDSAMQCWEPLEQHCTEFLPI